MGANRLLRCYCAVCRKELRLNIDSLEQEITKYTLANSKVPISLFSHFVCVAKMVVVVVVVVVNRTGSID
jgi:hypothetical protein